MSYSRLALVLAAPLLLMSCLLTPGKFVSTLDIKSDRSFTFTYAGEVVLLDPAATMSSSSGTGANEDGEDDGTKPARAKPIPEPETAERIAERRSQAETLAKEAGYRSVEYLGDNKFRVDYAVSGKLDRGFVYPINTDLDSIIPWIAVEIRRDGTARVKAMAFGEKDSSGMSEASPTADAAESREGTFTFTTDAELVMHNNEEGLAPGPGKKIVWTVTPTSKTVPTAVVRFAN
ncbi:hypothetical protein [Sphingosinicella rhizophila]|uniref:Lipoprotein n=1 Tax=Sphingosinicella rhizophila TaxID=3050082 RepID=A0ABU3Q6R7_9SPHN|nr:hypothetical protein [Sphingosinicella sp. GR2756]MDT9599106.1 hypothetical protein [Sphingosinicella sp. GR2756]